MLLKGYVTTIRHFALESLQLDCFRKSLVNKKSDAAEEKQAKKLHLLKIFIAKCSCIN